MITRHHYEEWFLLYVDDELSSADRRSVENFVRENPDLREELETLQQCRLIPEEEISFGSRGPLLRYAAGNRPIVPISRRPLTRVAAAALVLLLGGISYFIAIKRNTGAPIPNDGTAVAAKKDHPAVTQPGPHTLYHRTSSDHASSIGMSRHPHVPKHPQPPAEQTADDAFVAMKQSTPGGLAAIDPVNNRLPERIFVMGGDTALLVPGDLAQQEPRGKNKQHGVFGKITRAIGATADRDANDRRSFLIGNLQIALK